MSGPAVPELDWASASQRVQFGVESARVRRWHTETVLYKQTVGEHVYSALLLLFEVCYQRPSVHLLKAVLLHDTAERRVGDIPSPTKRKAGIRAAMDALEDEEMLRLGYSLPVLNDCEAWVVKLVDLLEGLAHCSMEAKMGNRLIKPSFDNYKKYTALHIAAQPEGIWSICDTAAAQTIQQHFEDAYVFCQ